MRYKELDGLRGLAALSVYFSHLLGLVGFKSQLFDCLSNSPLHLLWHGEAAVFLFFLLSGFVLTLPYIKNRSHLNLFPFYIKRIFRIYPAFILAILFSITVKLLLFQPNSMVVFSDWINEFWKWNNKDISLSELFKTLILVGPSFDTKLFVPIIWTLRIEMIISFILPFLIYLALRVKVYVNVIVFLSCFS